MDTPEHNPADAAANEGLDPEIEAQMAADEAEWSRQAASTGRDDRGRFTSATEAQRASQAAAEKPGDEPEDPTTAQQSDEQQQATQGKDSQEQIANSQPKKPADAAAATNGKPGEQKPATTEAKPAEAGKGSAWARENERKAKTWEGINQTKAELQAEREQLKLEREQFAAQQQQASTQQRDPATGYAAADYERYGKRFEADAQRLTQEALAADQAGDFDKADRLTAKAGEQSQLAKAAMDRARSLQAAGPGNVWERLKADLPEAMQFNGPINVELRKLLRTNQQLLADPFGPYRAAVQVGRNVLQATEQKLATANAEAAKVPQLQKQIEELSARVAELTRKTSLPGGGGAISRGGSEGKSFADLSLEQMEAQLQAEAAA